MGDLQDDLLQAIYDTARDRYDEAIRTGNPLPIGSSEIQLDLLNRGYKISETEVKDGFRILERYGIVGLGSGGIFCSYGNSLFIEDFFQ